jgi:predicted enzyme related to lactoylglutathione lyase
MLPLVLCRGYVIGRLDPRGANDAQGPATPNELHMEKVTGIGGVFFKARDPDRLAAWYREHLGIAAKNGYADFTWRETDPPSREGRTVWALFPADTDYFGASSAPFMLNYRVANLDRMLEQLRLGGITIEKTDDDDNGRFAWITDPEGRRIELWEPKGK